MMKLSCVLLLASALPSLGLDQKKAGSYLTLISALESDQAFQIVAELKFPGNDTALLFDQINETREKLLMLTNSGLGHNHPVRQAKKRQLLKLLRNRSESLEKSKTLLKSLSTGQISLTQLKINKLQSKLQDLQTNGLGHNHPEVKTIFHLLQQATD